MLFPAGLGGLDHGSDNHFEGSPRAGVAVHGTIVELVEWVWFPGIS
jgi:hypothetical protein